MRISLWRISFCLHSDWSRIAAQGGPSSATSYSYDPAGNLSGYTYSTSLQTGNVFDPLNRLTKTCIATSSPACSASQPLASYAYTLGAAGNRTNVLESNNRNVAYGYDNDYRLTSEAITADPSGHNGTVSYNGYDNVGNRTLMTSTLSAVPGGAFSYDNNDRLSVDTFDNNGNTTSSGGISNSYDFENRMLTHGSVTVVYDGEGNRVSETTGGVITKYLVDDLNPTGLPQVVDETVSGSVTRTYAYGLQRISENQLVGSTWTPSYYGHDGHGNVRLLTNKSETVTDSYDYDAFGMPIRTSGTTANNFRYSGEWSDSSIGLYHLRARYYNQATGRFWARDSNDGLLCNPVTLNPYIYTGNNSVNTIDPTGLSDIAEEEKIQEFEIRTIIPKELPTPGINPGGPSQWIRYGGIAVITAGVYCGLDLIGTGINAVYQAGSITYVQQLYWNGWCNLATKPFRPTPPEPEPDCTKASPWQLKKAGITDEHQFKQDFVGKRGSGHYDICACKDGSIVLKY